MGKYYYPGHTYEIVKTAMTWSAAKAWAESQSGHLAYITSATENQALVSMTQTETGLDTAPSASDGGGARYLWLGGSDADVEGTWRWGDGTLVTSGYSNWGAGAFGAEPDDYGGVQDALAFGLQSWPQPSGGIGVAYKWNDVNPANSLYFVVEWDHIRGSTGADTISRTGGETVYGLEGNDVISYASGYNYLRGDAGDDWIWGDKGNDTISGGAGADIFHSLTGAAIDRILDFNFAEGDRLVLDGGPSRTITQVGADVVVDMGNGDQAILVGVSLDSLGSGWIA